MPPRKRVAPTDPSAVVEDLLVQVRARFARMRETQPGVTASFVEHLRSLAVCHPECGAREFIVDGSTQRCDRCGGSMFRTEAAVTYRRDEEPARSGRRAVRGRR